MTIKDFLLSKPDARQFRIDYLFENFCPECKRYTADLDEEYSTDGTAGEFRQQVDDTSAGICNHYREYPHVYEFDTDDFEVDVTETDTETVIIITMPGDARTCAGCEEKHLDELAADAEDCIILPTQEEIEADRRKYNELLTWAQSLTAEQIAFLCNGGWYNATMKGYAIRAGREFGLDDDKIREFLRCMSYAHDVMDKDDADKLYMDF